MLNTDNALVDLFLYVPRVPW